MSMKPTLFTFIAMLVVVCSALTGFVTHGVATAAHVGCGARASQTNS